MKGIIERKAEKKSKSSKKSRNKSMVNISSERQNIWTTELALNATRNGEPKLRKKTKQL